MLQLAHLRSSSIGYKEEGYSRKGKLFPGTLWHTALFMLSLQFVFGNTSKVRNQKTKQNKQTTQGTAKTAQWVPAAQA